MVTHIQIDDRPACPRNCATYQQYGDCGHQRPSEVVDLKREIAALHASRLRLATALVDYMTGFDPKEIASGHFTTLIATRDEAQRIVREEG